MRSLAVQIFCDFASPYMLDSINQLINSPLVEVGLLEQEQKNLCTPGPGFGFCTLNDNFKKQMWSFYLSKLHDINYTLHYFESFSNVLMKSHNSLQLI